MFYDGGCFPLFFVLHILQIRRFPAGVCLEIVFCRMSFSNTLREQENRTDRKERANEIYKNAGLRK